MLGQEIQKLSPQLYSFMDLVSPEMLKEDVTVRKPKAIPRSRRFVGRCFMFRYKNPMTKGTPKLPYFHFFPTVVMLEQREDTLLGLNLFYLDRVRREKLLDIMIGNLMGDEDDPETKSRVSYKIISRYSQKYKNAFPCIKQYTHKRMGQFVVEVPPKLWREMYLGNSSYLHERMFRGANVKQIWNESRTKAIEESRKRI